jgi:hypothetical protein
MLLVTKLSRLLRYGSIALIQPKFKGWGWWCVLSWLVAGCVAPPPPLFSPGPRPSLPFAADRAEALPKLIQHENAAAIARDIGQLGLLWATESQVVDGRGTADTADDYVWSGHAAILDRYRLAVFPNPPSPLTLPPDLLVEITGHQATLRNGQDRWRFIYQAGRWWISELVYSQP